MGRIAAPRFALPGARGQGFPHRSRRAVALVPSLLIAIACGGGGQTPTAAVPPSPGTPSPAPPPSPPPPPPLPPEIGSPCPGVVVRGDPPERDDSVFRATLLIDWASGSDGGFDWAGPYFEPFPDREIHRSLLLEVNVAEWRVEMMEGATRHTLEIEWPYFLETGLHFRSGDGGCGLSLLACSATGCELRP